MNHLVSVHLTVVIHPTPDPAPQGAGRKRILGIFAVQSAVKIPKKSRFIVMLPI